MCVCAHIFFFFSFPFVHSIGLCSDCVRRSLLLDLSHLFFSSLFLFLSFSVKWDFVCSHLNPFGFSFSFSHFTLPCISFVFLSFDVAQNGASLCGTHLRFWRPHLYTQLHTHTHTFTKISWFCYFISSRYRCQFLANVIKIWIINFRFSLRPFQ